MCARKTVLKLAVIVDARPAQLITITVYAIIITMSLIMFILIAITLIIFVYNAHTHTSTEALTRISSASHKTCIYPKKAFQNSCSHKLLASVYITKLEYFINLITAQCFICIFVWCRKNYIYVIYYNTAMYTYIEHIYMLSESVCSLGCVEVYGYEEMDIWQWADRRNNSIMSVNLLNY